MIRGVIFIGLAMVVAVTPAAKASRSKVLRDVMCLARDELYDASDRFALNRNGLARAHQ